MRDRKKYLKVIVAVILLFFGILLMQRFLHSKGEWALPPLGWDNLTTSSPSACIREKCFNLEIPKNIEDYQVGLSKFDTIDDSFGMLFLYQTETIPSFWMKDMQFPIDIIWIDKDKKIVEISPSLPVCPEIGECVPSSPRQKVQYVLEIKAGIAEENNILVGDKVDLFL